jgi:hypothetical protein
MEERNSAWHMTHGRQGIDMARAGGKGNFQGKLTGARPLHASSHARYGRLGQVHNLEFLAAGPLDQHGASHPEPLNRAIPAHARLLFRIFITTPPLRHRQSENIARLPVHKPVEEGLSDNNSEQKGLMRNRGRAAGAEC